MAKREERQPWDRMPGESVRQYGWFCAYRDMRYAAPSASDEPPKLDLGRERSIRRIAEQLGRNKRTIGDLSARFDWVARCDAYDLHMLRRQRDRNEARIWKMCEDHAALAGQMQRRALRRLLTLGDEDISAADVVRMIDVAVKVERQSRGELYRGGPLLGERGEVPDPGRPDDPLSAGLRELAERLCSDGLSGDAPDTAGGADG